MPQVLTPGKLVPFTFGASAKGWHNIQPFTLCPKEHQFARVRRIKPRGKYVKEALAIGSMLHAARAQWLNDGYKGELWREAITKYAEALPKQEGKLVSAEAVRVAVTTFEAYVEYWSVRPKNKVLAVEYELEPRALQPGAPEWAWRGARLDSIEGARDGIWIGEAKSTSKGVASVTDMYILNGQTLLQAALWSPKEVKKFGPLAGILLDPIKKATATALGKAYPRVRLPLAHLSNALEWFRRDFTTWVMQSHLIEYNSTVERRPVCQRSYGPCDYKDLCLLGKKSAHVYEDEKGQPLSNWVPSSGKEVPPWA